MNKLTIFALPLLALALPGCATIDDAAMAAPAPIAVSADAPMAAPTQAETETILLDHIRILASDEYMGRKPGTEGGRMAVAYQVAKLKEYGYEPGWNGSFEQKVTLVAATAAKLMLMAGGKAIEGDDILSLGGATDFDGLELVAIDSVDAVDAGVAGKLIVVSNPAAMREILQAAIGAEAAGALIFAPDDMIEQFRPGTMRERVQLKGSAPGEAQPSIIFAGTDARRQIEAALGENLGGTVSGRFVSSDREFETANVIGKLPGSRPEAGAIVMMAHWDHTGECGAPDDEDKICNGAVDNASGVAAMLETARRLGAGPQLERDVYIFGTTAEEMGLLGARYFADNPPVPLDTIHAALNIDTISIAPAGSPLSVIGWNRTPLDESIKGVAAALGRTIEVGEESELYIRRQDGWALMNKGVPSVLVSSSFGDEKLTEQYMSTRYHRANDEIWDGYEIGGAASDVPVYVALMRHWATQALYSKPANWQFDDGAGE